MHMCKGRSHGVLLLLQVHKINGMCVWLYFFFGLFVCDKDIQHLYQVIYKAQIEENIFIQH